MVHGPSIYSAAGSNSIRQCGGVLVYEISITDEITVSLILGLFYTGKATVLKPSPSLSEEFLRPIFIDPTTICQRFDVNR